MLPVFQAGFGVFLLGQKGEKRNDIVRVNYPFSPWSRSLAEILATFVPTGSFSIRVTWVGLLAVSNSGSLSFPVKYTEEKTCNILL